MIYVGDREVTKEVNTAFYDALKNANHNASLYFAPDKNHVSIERELGMPGDNVFPVILNFTKNNLS